MSHVGCFLTLFQSSCLHETGRRLPSEGVDPSYRTIAHTALMRSLCVACGTHTTSVWRHRVAPSWPVKKAPGPLVGTLGSRHSKNDGLPVGWARVRFCPWIPTALIDPPRRLHQAGYFKCTIGTARAVGRPSTADPLRSNSVHAPICTSTGLFVLISHENWCLGLPRHGTDRAAKVNRSPFRLRVFTGFESPRDPVRAGKARPLQSKSRGIATRKSHGLCKLALTAAAVRDDPLYIEQESARGSVSARISETRSALGRTRSNTARRAAAADELQPLARQLQRREIQDKCRPSSGCPSAVG